MAWTFYSFSLLLLVKVQVFHSFQIHRRVSQLLQRLTSKSHVRLCSIIRFFCELHCSSTKTFLHSPTITRINPQQFFYPRVYLDREQPRGLYGPVPLDSVGRTQQFHMSWEKYCSLVHSKPLAMIILTFRDYTNAQNDNTRIQRGIPMYSRPSQILLSHLQRGIAPQQARNTMSAQNPGFTSNHVVNNTANYGYSAQNTLVRERP